MPSLSSRSVDLSGSHIRANPVRPEPPIVSIPTPHLPYLGRHPRMISSMPPLFATQDSAIRQFYGRNLPTGRVSQT